MCFIEFYEFSYLSADIILDMIKILLLQKSEVLLVLFSYSLFISISVYKANVFECRI